MATKILLIISDSDEDRSNIIDAFSHHNLLTAGDRLSAMGQISGNPDIDLILLDLCSPDIEGFKILNELKLDAHYKSLPVIILTNPEEPENEISGLRAGAVDYIRKPFQMESLNSRVAIHLELLRVSQLYEELQPHSFLTLNAVLNQAPVGICISYGSKTFIAGGYNMSIMNPAYEEITGRTKEELLELGWDKITHPEDVNEDLENFKKLQEGKISSYSMEKRFIKPDGSIVWVDMAVARLDLRNDSVWNQISIFQDITRKKEMESELSESERSKAILLANLPGMAYRGSLDRDWTMQFVSQGVYDLTGYTAESLENNRDISYGELIAPEYRESLWNEWENSKEKRPPFKHEYEIVTKAGQRKWVMEIGQSIYDEQGNLEALEGIIFDISDQKEHELKHKYLYDHDALTGLYNRRYFEELLADDAGSYREGKRAIININLSKIDVMTISYGFHYSQALIKKIAEAFDQYSTDNCRLFSTYVNRFTFYLKGYRDKDEIIAFCGRIIEILESILLPEGIGAGIGVLEIENGDAEVKDILRNVLVASENALSDSNHLYNLVFFDKELEQKVSRREKIKNALDSIAVGDDEGIYIQYQPIFDVKTGDIHSFEALTRIRDDELGIVPPLEFIPIAEETKLIIPIGMKIIYHAITFLKKLKFIGYDSIRISINVSVIQLLKDDFNSSLIGLLDDMDIPPEKLIIEITESTFSDNFKEINKWLGELRDLGIDIAIDDFGTGYSSFSREKELNVNCLKIDRAFIKKLTGSDPEKAIIGDIISMAHKLGHYVVAEGVEDEEQMQYLFSNECDMIQGYLLGRPMDENSAIDLLDKMNNDFH